MTSETYDMNAEEYLAWLFEEQDCTKHISAGKHLFKKYGNKIAKEIFDEIFNNLIERPKDIKPKNILDKYIGLLYNDFEKMKKEFMNNH